MLSVVPFLLLQGASSASGPPPGPWDVAKYLGVALLGWVAYEARAIRATQQAMSTTMTEMRTVMTGAPGVPGGMVKRVDELGARVHTVENMEQASRGRDEVLQFLAQALRDGQKMGGGT